MTLYRHLYIVPDAETQCKSWVEIGDRAEGFEVNHLMCQDRADHTGKHHSWLGEVPVSWANGYPA